MRVFRACGLFLVALGVGSWLLEGWAGASTERIVPLSPRWEAYARLPAIALMVRECGIFEFQGGFRVGDLAKAARAAAAAWTSLGLAIPLSVSVESGACEEGLPRFGNGRNEIYWTGRLRPSGEFGDYVVEYTPDGRIREQDIRIDAFRIAQAARLWGADKATVLYNALLHELGHALGLGDAYETDPEGCGWSVMLALCSSERLSPTDRDREALVRIYEPSASRRSSRPQDALVELDTNRNGRLDDPEVFRAVDLWVRGELADGVLFDAIEAWVEGKSLRPLGSRAPRGTENGWVFVTLYDLQGRRVGGTLSCTPLSPRGLWQQRLKMLTAPRRLPAGTYLVLIRDCRTGAVTRLPVLYGP